MNKIKIVKIISLISFLLIVYPGKLSFVNFIFLALPIWNFFLMIGVESISFFLIAELLISFLTIASLFFLFNKNRYVVFLNLSIQYSYLVYTFNNRYLKYWEYLIPVLIYLVFSFILIYLFLNSWGKKKINFEG